MKNLPKNLSLALLVILGVSVSSLLLPTASEAASAYISPATGFIKESNFKISVYVESTTAEPEIASAQLKITYPEAVSVVSVTEGEFDSYLDKSADATTRTISINALNNAGNYKSGKVKVASISFDAAVDTGQVQLTITPDSEINGSGGEQLLTETVNGVYTLDIAPAVGAPSATTTTTTTTPESTTGASIKTGGNQIGLYLAISLGLVALGVISYTNPLKRA
jgi:hypothetical protein